MNANGQQFNEDGTLATQLGNKGELNYIGDYLKGGGKLDPALTALFQGLDSSVKRTIIDGHNGNLTLANGQQINWQDLLNKAQTALDQIQTNTATTAAAIPIFALTRMAPDFNTARLGTANPPTGGGGSGLVGGLPGTVQGAPIPGAGGAVRPPVIVNIHAPVVGSNGMQELADIIDKAQTRNQYYNHNNRGFNEN